MSVSHTHKETFAEVIVPAALRQQYTWKVPGAWVAQLKIGHRVEVSLGPRKKYAGIVKRLHHQRPEGITVKEIVQVLDAEPIVTSVQLRFWDWMASYYLCTEGEVMAAALPAPFRSCSENPDQAFKPKEAVFLALAPRYSQDENLEALLRHEKRAPQQLALLMTFLQLAAANTPVAQRTLLQRSGASAATLKALVQKEILIPEKRSVDRIPQLPARSELDFALSALQQKALEQLQTSWKEKNVCLLHGVTASGKTHVYMALIAQALQRGEQVLYMLPEIALTAQIIRRLQHCFGGQVGVYHSKFSQQERAEIWQKLYKGQLKVIIGARSALFLPFVKLGLVICDEEHDPSYKQQEPAPRYQGRDAAIYLASLCGARTLLGSGTPSVETYYQARQGKFGLALLTERFADVSLPPLKVIDMRAVPLKSRKGGFLTPALEMAMDKVLRSDRQVILFQNRRGYVPYQVCSECGWIPECRHCDVSLTLHKKQHQLLCHYCGSGYPMVDRCATCGAQAFTQRNFGTELIEEQLQQLFPQARIARMDVDAIRGKQTHAQLVRQFEQGMIDILIGTQMVVKGLDADRVDLVGILDADGLLHFTDFRVHERAFQLMEQVSGRAGRKEQTGEVIVQTSQPTHPVLQWVIAHDYPGFFEEEIAKRREFFYPPFSRLTLLSFRHRQQEISMQAARSFARSFDALYGKYLSGPAPAVIPRVRNQYRTDLLIKLPVHTALIRQCKQDIRSTIDRLLQQKQFGSLQVVADVDIN